LPARPAPPHLRRQRPRLLRPATASVASMKRGDGNTEITEEAPRPQRDEKADGLLLGDLCAVSVSSAFPSPLSYTVGPTIGGTDGCAGDERGGGERSEGAAGVCRGRAPPDRRLGAGRAVRAGGAALAAARGRAAARAARVLEGRGVVRRRAAAAGERCQPQGA